MGQFSVGVNTCGPDGPIDLRGDTIYCSFRAADARLRSNAHRSDDGTLRPVHSVQLSLLAASTNQSVGSLSRDYIKADVIGMSIAFRVGAGKVAAPPYPVIRIRSACIFLLRVGADLLEQLLRKRAPEHQRHLPILLRRWRHVGEHAAVDVAVPLERLSAISPPALCSPAQEREIDAINAIAKRKVTRAAVQAAAQAAHFQRGSFAH